MTWQPGESGNPGGRPKEYGRVRDLAREEIRVALDEFETKDASYDMVSMRVFYEDGGEYRPGRNGLFPGLSSIRAFDTIISRLRGHRHNLNSFRCFKPVPGIFWDD